VSFLGGSGRSTKAAATARCIKCGYSLLATQVRCPECGSLVAPPSSSRRQRVVQLYQQGPQAVWPIAIRFSAMGAVAATGMVAVFASSALSLLFGIGTSVSFAAAIAWLMAPLPFVVLLSMPFGWGSIGAEGSALPVERARILGVPLHKLALATAGCWWLLSALIFYGPNFPGVAIVALAAAIGAGASAYLHLCWLTDLGLAVSDHGPHRALNICVGVAIVSAIVAIVGGVFLGSWVPVFAALGFVVLVVVLAEIWAALELARDMIATLIAAYEEVAREQRRAERAARHGPNFPV